VVGDEIVTSDDIHLATGSAVILARSESLLHTIAQPLITHPEIRKVERCAGTPTSRERSPEGR